MNQERNFSQWFKQATGNEPYPYQTRFAWEPTLPELVDVPTGMGKTAMAVLGWLWRRRFAEEKVRKATPRRLVYCLPMRVLVEQTAGCAKRWIESLKERGELAEQIPVHVLMGGEIDNDWDAYPEADAILIGTQDQTLSRALNRGYGIGRGRWPMHFALLNNDCLWVMDEVQLMDTGLATSAQLWAFRRRWTPMPGSPIANLTSNGVEPKAITPAVFGNTTTVWMSATLQKSGSPQIGVGK
jgi:CRISPR-associated endonuclease/helicase Cas3